MKFHGLLLATAAALFCFSFGNLYAGDIVNNEDSFLPWSVSQDHPVISLKDAKPQKGNNYGIKSSPYVSIFWMFNMYKLASSSEASCTFYPTCSRYTVEAVFKHGFVPGLIMGAERIMRFHHDARGYKLFKEDDALKIYDPLKNNDFWFSDHDNE